MMQRHIKGTEWACDSVDYKNLSEFLDGVNRGMHKGDGDAEEDVEDGSGRMTTMQTDKSTWGGSENSARYMLSETEAGLPPLARFDRLACLELDKVNEGFRRLSGAISAHLTQLEDLVDKNVEKMNDRTRKDPVLLESWKNTSDALELELFKILLRVESLMQFSQVQWMAFFRLFRMRSECLLTSGKVDAEGADDAVECLVAMLLKEQFMKNKPIEDLQRGLMRVYYKNEKKNVKGAEEEGEEEHLRKGENLREFGIVAAALRNSSAGRSKYYSDHLFDRCTAFLLGLVIVLFGIMVRQWAEVVQTNREGEWTSILVRHQHSVFRFWFLVILFQLCVGWAFWFMRKHKVNFRFLLHIPNRVREGLVINVALVQLVVAMTTYIIYHSDVFGQDRKEMPKHAHWYPAGLTVGLLVVLLICGLRTTRRFFMVVLLVLADGFGAGIWARPVSFADGLIGDVFTSMVVPVQDLIRSISYFVILASGTTPNNTTLHSGCASETMGHRTLFGLLFVAGFWPLWVRLMQNVARVVSFHNPFPSGYSFPKLLRQAPVGCMKKQTETERESDHQQQKEQPTETLKKRKTTVQEERANTKMAFNRSGTAESLFPAFLSQNANQRRPSLSSSISDLSASGRTKVDTEDAGEREEETQQTDKDTLRSVYRQATLDGSGTGGLSARQSVAIWAETDRQLQKRRSVLGVPQDLPSSTTPPSSLGGRQQTLKQKSRPKTCGDLSLPWRLWLNALKYTFSIIPGLLTATHACGLNSGDWISQSVFRVLATAYSMTWDYTEDWRIVGLAFNKYPRDLLYPRAYYIFAVIFNFFGRLTWTYSMTGRISGVELPFLGRDRRVIDYVVTVSAVMEIFRRAIWMTIRIEQEHITNSGQYRGLLFVPDCPHEEHEKPENKLGSLLFASGSSRSSGVGPNSFAANRGEMETQKETTRHLPAISEEEQETAGQPEEDVGGLNLTGETEERGDGDSQPEDAGGMGNGTQLRDVLESIPAIPSSSVV
uniref:EXS domain-containing protein n=1 Tax=Chromera velia CCMP2878 TaxID=1169474 RepID=A0A0G4F3X0_9ALVE|eukprot:Cvel_2686.t1-p1 / transcript=Cvel_2686.t1 / gene=Cvel_2686 / organism=Chromera_velia_CCMP2878 / gene_product=Phosphate transporter PHO1 homolog 8, putative / transcript_product=Phosphate transporter PHO1 homolog 8, putative / location=Cvel_scaffold107:91968-98686(+) / protein_length=999 / sequence_SO=supercontig / SO=protein_coding / is_pseudo=false